MKENNQINEIIESIKDNEFVLRNLFGIGSHEYNKRTLKEKEDALKYFKDIEKENILKLAMDYVEYYHKEKSIPREKLLLDVVITLSELYNKKL